MGNMPFYGKSEPSSGLTAYGFIRQLEDFESVI